MSLNNKENIYDPPLWQKGLNRLRALLYRSPFYLFTLKKGAGGDLDILPDLLRHGNAQHAAALKLGNFPFAGRLYKSNAQPWTTAQDDRAWQAWVHSFGWLGDLCQHNDADAIVKARSYIQDWIDLHGVWTPLAWRADVIGDRLVNWMVDCDVLCASASDELKQTFQSSLSLQASHLSRRAFRDLGGYTLLKALRGQLYVCLFLSAFSNRRERVLARLVGELDAQIFADGGHISRSPQILCEVLALALELVDVLSALKIECPDGLRLAIDRMAPMVRTLRHGDGKLGLFHGAQEGTTTEIDTLLDRTQNQGQPLSDARHSGYQRIEAGRSVILMDVGAPPDVRVNPYGHAAPLSMEISSGEERILVNCGAVVGGDPHWQDALCASAAHNGLVVDDKNCLAVLHGGGLLPHQIQVSSKRFEENGQVLIEATHDAYKEAMGLIYQRSLYINKTGDDLRVEDRLTGMGGSSYSIHLHLHPDIHASLLQDGQAALLKTPNGAGWHLRIQGGKLEIRESIYIGQPGQMRHSDQIVIQGPLRGEGVCVKWRLSKISG